MEIRNIDVEGYEQVVHAEDPESGLIAYIGVHNTTLGPSLGGLRMWPYSSRDEALTDVLRLSEGMTYKSAVARCALGGGKSVILGHPDKHRTPALLQAMGRVIESLDGHYITAADVNMRVEDLREVRKTTRWVTGLSREEGGSGNPAPFTAEGVYLGMVACLERVFDSNVVSGRHVALQGAGSVAASLMERLLGAGARVTACDIDPKKVETLGQKNPAIEWVHPDSLFDVDCDILAPHALGAVLNDETIPRLKCSIVAGAANNQLAKPHHGDALVKRGILYAPDFLINAGGILNISCELEEDGYDENRALTKIANIPMALHEVFSRAEAMGTSTDKAALDVALGILGG